MKNYINNFLLIIQFMTKIPININLKCEKDNFKRGTAFLPLVGFIIGGIQFLIFFVTSMFLPHNIVSILVVLTGILVTGALHIDGLGDTFDGFFALKGNDKIIEIMKDSTIGTYSCIAIIFDIIIKIASVNYAIDKKLPLIIIAIPVISRGVQVFLFYIGNTAKNTGTGNLYIGNVGKIQLCVAVSIMTILSMVLIGTKCTLILIVFDLCFTFLFNKFCIHKIGGLTGDTLGANSEMLELISFVIFIALNKSFI